MHDPAAEATVFVIDDDARMRAAMERLLKSVGLLAESFATGYISSTFQQAIVFAILIAVMLVRPSGLLGRAAVQKV